MHKVLFVTTSFDIGGTNTSLINLLAGIDKSKYDLFVYAINNTGPLRKDIEENATVLNSSFEAVAEEKAYLLRRYLSTIAKSLLRLLRRFGIDPTPLYFAQKAKSFKEYDCIIAFQEGNVTQLVSYCNNCKKIAWIRSEYGRYLKIAKKKPEKRLYRRFDAIINVSETAKQNFLQYLPECCSKTHTIYNLLNKERVLSLSEESVDLPGVGTFVIISIGRVDPVKHFSEIPEISLHLIEKGITNFQWLIIGGKTQTDPQEFENIESQIIKKGLNKNVFLMGNQKNPYSYLKRSKILVCLSESETFNHTFAEARILGVPILSVNYDSAKEFLLPGQGGSIVKRESISKSLSDYIVNEKYYNVLKEEVKNFNHNNRAEVEKLYAIIS